MRSPTPTTAARVAAACALALVCGAACNDEAAPPADSAPPVEATAAAPDFSAPDLFTEWLRYEEPARRDSPSFRKFYVDATLGHQVFRMPPQGVPPYVGRALLLDDDKLLFPSGRRLWNRKLEHTIGLSGEFCFIHSTYCLPHLFDVSFSVDGVPSVVYDNQYTISRFPSHTTIDYRLGPVAIQEHKLITYDDRAAALYEARSLDGAEHTLRLEALVPHPRLPRGGTVAPSYPLLGGGSFQNNPLFLYLDAPAFARLPGDFIHLSRELHLAAGGAPSSAALAVAFAIAERSADAPPLPSLIEHASEYNRWFAENVPYFDCSDPAFKKMWYYRWWIVRFHLVDLRDGATEDLRDFAFYEGKLGFDNPIVFAVPAQLKELAYLRDPAYALSQLANAYRNRAANGAIVDPPGSPYWGETYSHWTVQAAAELNRVQPIPRRTLAELLPLMAADVRAWMSAYDADGDALPERSLPRVTGYDLDILSWWFWAGTKLDQEARPPAMERVDFASFVYGNAAGLVELAAAAGDDALAAEFRDLAARIRGAALEQLWDDETAFFYAQRASDGARAPLRELHGLFPFATGLAPDQATYRRALRYLVDPQEFWARFPPVITSQAHYRDWSWEMDGLTRNIAPHPISMGGRTVLQAIRHYDQDVVTAGHLMELLRRYNDLVYPGVHPNDPTWRPNAHEYYSQWEPYAREPRPKPSDISHDFHSMWLSLVIEGPVGLVPRADDVLEIDPLADDWAYFLVDGLRYRGRDVTVAWDRPGDGAPRYDGFPEGLSVRIDGSQVAHRDDLGRLEIDLAAQR
jgi:hypothetical protein